MKRTRARASALSHRGLWTAEKLRILIRTRWDGCGAVQRFDREPSVSFRINAFSHSDRKKRGWLFFCICYYQREWFLSILNRIDRGKYGIGESIPRFVTKIRYILHLQIPFERRGITRQSLSCQKLRFHFWWIQSVLEEDIRSNTELNGTSLKVIAMGIGGWSIKRSQVKGGLVGGVETRDIAEYNLVKAEWPPRVRGLRDAPDRIYGALNPGQCSFPPPPPPPLRRSFSGVARDAILSFFVANSTRPTNELKFIETNFFSICCTRLEEVAEYFYTDASSCFCSKRCRSCYPFPFEAKKYTTHRFLYHRYINEL